MGLFDGEYEGGFWKGFLKGGAEGATAGTILGPPGMIIGGTLGALMGGFSGAQQEIADERMAEDERIRVSEALRELGAQNQAANAIYAGAAAQPRRSTRAQINSQPITDQPTNQGILGQAPGSSTSGTF